MNSSRPKNASAFKPPSQIHPKPLRLKPRPTTAFKAPSAANPDVEPTYQRPNQPAVNLPIPRAADVSSARKQQRTNSIDSAIIQRKKAEHYRDLFNRTERMLTLQYSAHLTLLEYLDELHNLTAEYHEKNTTHGVRNDTDVSQMDAYGTQLWNVSVCLFQAAGTGRSEEEDQYIAKIRRIACLQLELGIPLPLEVQTASRLLTTAVQTALMWLDIEMAQAQILLERCEKWAKFLLDVIEDHQPNRLAAEGVTSYYCAKYAFVRATKSGIAEFELENAVKNCENVSPDSWIFHETINYCLDHAQQLFKEGLADQEGSKNRTNLLKSARTHFVGALSLMEGHRQFNSTYSEVGKLLAQCSYELAQATGSEEEYQEALQVLEDREKLLQDKSSKRNLAQSILLRLGIADEKRETPENMLILWRQYSQTREVKAEDINQIIRIVTAREAERLLQGAYAFDVIHLVIDAILWRPEGPVHKMIAKLLFTMFQFIQDEGDIHLVKRTFNLICATNFKLAEDIILCCQSALFSLGEQRKEAYFFKLAGHEVFSIAPLNILRAFRKAAWMYIEMGHFRDAHEALQAIPIESNDASTTFLGLCIIHIRQNNETLAIKSLKVLVEAEDFSCHFLIVIIKEAQVAKMAFLLIETLRALVIKAQDDESASNLDIPIILRTVLKLQLDAAERNGGFNQETCSSFCSMVRIARDILGKIAQAKPKNEQSADIVTWLYKTTYNVYNEDKHIITPAARCDLANLSLELFDCRQGFEVSMDDESFHMAVWASIHILTAQATLAKKVQVSAEEEHFTRWVKVIQAAQDTQTYLEEAKKRNKGGVTSFNDTETAVDVVLVEALANIKQWETVASLLLNRKGIISPDALEAITHLICKDETSPIELKINVLREIVGIMWNFEKESTTNVARFASWMEMLIKVHLQDDSKDRVEELEYDFNAICNELSKSAIMRRKWPKESLSWMITECWNVGIKYLNTNTNKAEALFATAVRLAELDIDCGDRVNDMKSYLDHYKAENEVIAAAAATSWSYT